jgi:hypothetical protein
VEAVDILLGRDGSMTLWRRCAGRQRQLHQDAVDGRVGVELVDARQQLGLARWQADFSSTECMPTLSQALTLLRT